MKNNQQLNVEIRISKAKVISYVLASIFLIILGVVSIAADSGGFALLILILGIFWIIYCLPYLIKINQPYLKIKNGQLQYNHAFENRKIKLSQIRKIKVVTETEDVSNSKQTLLSVNVHACLIRIYLADDNQPLVINPSYVGDARDFKKFEQVASEIG